MHKIKRICSVIMTLLIFMCISTPVMAANYTITEEGDNYIKAVVSGSRSEIIVDDRAALLGNSQSKELISTVMKDCADYGSVALVTVDINNYSSTETFASAYFSQEIGEYYDGLLFVIDMDKRDIIIYTGGFFADKISSSKADVIADNIYRDCSQGNYYKASDEMFREALALVKGNHIAQPMKYLSNACLSVLIALIVTYFYARRSSKVAAPTTGEIAKSIKSKCNITNPQTRFLNTTRIRIESNSSGRGGHGGGHGGGHHSSGGHHF